MALIIQKQFSLNYEVTGGICRITKAGSMVVNGQSVNYGNSVMKAAGKPTFSDGTLVVNDFIGADTKSVLMAWQNLSYNVRTDKVGRMADYKKNCYLQEYTPDWQLVRTWRLIGCWVSGLSEDQFSHDSSDKKTISATITFDKAYMELPDEEEQV